MLVDLLYVCVVTSEPGDVVLIDGFPKGTGAPATRAFKAAGYQHYRDLAGVPRAELAALHGVGPKSLRIIGELLESEGTPLR